MKRAWLAGVLMACEMAAASAWAQSSPPAELLLFTKEELAVTATRTSTPISQSPSATTVITRDEIHRSGLWHIPDLLRRVPGVDVASTTASHSEVNIRGLNKALSARSLVLVDGRTVFINGQGFTPWEAIPVLTEDIEQIEVVKGPVQALYGSPAISGVINVITRSPFDIHGTELYQSFGNKDAFRSSVIHGGTIHDDIGYKVTAGWKSWDSFERGTNADAADGVTWTGSVAKKLGDRGQVLLSGGMSDGDFDLLPSDATGIGPMEYRADYAKLDTHVDGFKAQYFWNRYDFNVTTTNIDEDLTINTHDMDLSQELALGPHTLLAGMGTRYEQVDSNIFKPRGELKTETTWDLFAQDEWHVCQPLTWFGTIRLDRHPITGYNIAYRTSLVLEPIENQVFWATMGRTFRNPTISESKFDLTFPTLVAPATSTHSIGNELLHPEIMQSYEVGYRSRWLDRIKFSTSVFYNRIDQVISGVSDALDLPTLTTPVNFFNNGKAKIIGTEVESEVYLTSWLSTFASWVYQDVERDPGFPESDLSPHQKASLGFASTYKGFSGDLFIQFVDVAAAPEDRAGMFDTTGKVDPYWWTSARVGYALNDHADIALLVHNVFHDVHREHAAGQTMGTRFVLQGLVKF